MPGIPIKPFYMIRHGETVANKAKIMAGSLNSPLTDLGREQAKLVHKVLPHLPRKPSRIVHSNLSRARDTAHIINEALNIELYEDKNLAEMHTGDWEGKSYDECRTLFFGWDDPPNGETSREFIERIRRFKIATLTSECEPALLVGHGGVFRAFWNLYDIDSYGVKNCKLYEFEPLETPLSHMPKFPWRIWRYDLDEQDNVQRVQANPAAYPKAEVA